MRLKGKVAIVTGAASGIGAAIVRAYIAEGARVYLADIDQDGARRLATELGDAATSARMDVTDDDEVERVIDDIERSAGGIDILVSNAGIQHLDTIANVPTHAWRRIMAVHLDGGFFTARACLKRMYARGRGGSIIFMGSVHSKEASVAKGPYVVAKHGLLGLTRVIAKEGAPYGVRANIICPGFVRTPLVERQIGELAQSMDLSEEQVIKDVMLRTTIDGEFTTSSDIAEVAVTLAAFPSNALTGQSIIVSHGWHMG